jgi:hypothetical protein
MAFESVRRRRLTPLAAWAVVAVLAVGLAAAGAEACYQRIPVESTQRTTLKAIAARRDRDRSGEAMRRLPRHQDARRPEPDAHGLVGVDLESTVRRVSGVRGLLAIGVATTADL